MIFGKGGLEDEIKQAREQEHLNKYYAIHLDITSFITGVSDRDRIVDEMVARVIADIKGEFPDVRYSQWGTLMDVLLVGVNYDKKSKRHECRIERWGGSHQACIKPPTKSPTKCYVCFPLWMVRCLRAK